jgi:glycolate oxidase FAD binding subunit
MDLHATLAGICGDDAVRAATADDQIAGAKPALVVSPASTEQVGEVLRAADAAGTAACVAGSGTALHIGARPTALDVVLSTARLDRIIEHSPGDLQIKAQAGVRLSAVARHLSGEHQRLALDPPHDGTVGGILATAASGPLRHRYGGPRDLVLGVTLALADGTVAKAGGKVVKNVAGYDLCKLVTGSYGTLAVIVDATFRLHHVPASAVTLRHALRGGAGLAATLDAYAKVEPSALEVDLDLASGDGHVTSLLEGTPSGVAARAETVRTRIGGDLDSGGLPAPPQGPLAIAVNVRPGGVSAFIDATRAAVGAGRVTGRAGVGLLTISLDPASDPAIDPAAALATVRALAAEHDGAAVVLVAPDHVALDIWGPVRGLELMRRIKAQFDPRGRLAPGRFVGGI